MMDERNIFADSQFAIDHVDDVLARKLLKEIDGFLSQPQNQTDSRALSQLNDLKLKLSIVNLPNLSEDAAADVLRNHYMESFAIGVSMENRLTALLFFYPEIPRDELRKKLKIALVQNQQQIGQLTIGQWIQEFEKMFSVKTRDLSASVRFSIEHPQARELSPVDREKLKELLHVYDYLLVTTLPATGPVLEQILRAAPLLTNETESLLAPVSNAGPRRSSPPTWQQKQEAQEQENAVSSKPVQETFADALKNYPHLGEQQITSEPLKIRVFPTPVRPSIKNWISDYHDAMGAGKHSPIDRGNYLFHSGNGKKLSASERQKLSGILKALDENSVVSVDPGAQKIIFENMVESQKENKEILQARRLGPGIFPLDSAPRQENARNGDVVRPGNMENFTSQKAETRRPQEKSARGDIFERYAPRDGRSDFSKSFSPNFAKMPTIKVEKIGRAEQVTPAVQRNEADSIKMHMNNTGNVQSPDISRPEKSSQGIGTDIFSSTQTVEKKYSPAGSEPSYSKPSGSVSFSSPQKLPVEQDFVAKIQPVKPAASTVDPDTSKTAHPAAPRVAARPPIKRNPFHISPSNYTNEDSIEAYNEDFKKGNNIINLRN